MIEEARDLSTFASRTACLNFPESPLRSPYWHSILCGDGLREHLDRGNVKGETMNLYRGTMVRAFS
jgi:hypothetical protein